MQNNEKHSDLPVPSYKVLKTLVDEHAPDGSINQTMKLVKLGKTKIARMMRESEYVEIDYVLVASTSLRKTDADGTFVFEETKVIASDEDATQHDSILYYTLRALSVEEVLFTLGEV